MITGKTIISEEVFTELARTAMTKIDGIVIAENQKSSLASIARIVADKVAPQITVKKVDSSDPSGEETTNPTVAFELKISIFSGKNIPSTADKIRQAIKDEVEDVTGYKIERIDITVDKLTKLEATDEPPVLETNKD